MGILNEIGLKLGGRIPCLRSYSCLDFSDVFDFWIFRRFWTNFSKLDLTVFQNVVRFLYSFEFFSTFVRANIGMMDFRQFKITIAYTFSISVGYFLEQPSLSVSRIFFFLIFDLSNLDRIDFCEACAGFSIPSIW